MNNMILVKDAAARWNLTERRVSFLCKEGMIEGAKKHGRLWLIPCDAKKPVDHCVRGGGAWQKYPAS